ncbi:carboxypeptidase-like regulatory domain-containing protein [Niabella hibiscisoli]|uniref:carboxypeptidase-like regulatory domain-containing protein n=1 Tax=Niabella hibiscisoli TaxID=1825928 RepID=UPI001F0D82DB|nr:carboxypeptidase-like regulatory domain-containing protein [Niabella hibiscisoli]MCH5716454.1 carboxypeptidase-like regulatory domain-containing protein [Niabella hibiscisoli]
MQAKLKFRRSKLLNGGALLFLMMALSVVTHAQVTIKGTVTRADGMGIPGISVVVKASTNGTVTNDQGNYTIKSKKGDRLEFSGTGYVLQEVEVGDNDVINITLRETNVSMDEIVVVGYGTMRKKI